TVTTLNRFRVESINGRQLTLHADHVYGWDWNWQLVSSRTMALQILWEPLLGYIRVDIPSPDGRAITREEADALALTLHSGKNSRTGISSTSPGTGRTSGDSSRVSVWWTANTATRCGMTHVTNTGRPTNWTPCRIPKPHSLSR